LFIWLLILAGATAEVSMPPVLARMPTPRGPLRVAQRDFLIPRRPDLPNSRPVWVRVFYPAANTPAQCGQASHPPPPYASGDTARGLATFTGMPGLYFSHLPLVLLGQPARAARNYGGDDVFLGGAAAPLGQPVVFSHGLGGTRSAYTALCTELASHGRVVVAVEHADGTAAVADAISPGGAAEFYRRGVAIEGRVRQLHYRIRELEDVCHALAHASPAEDGIPEIVAAAFAPPRGDRGGDHGGAGGIHFVGHSFGGATVLALALDPTAGARLPRPIASVAALDPWLEPLRKSGLPDTVNIDAQMADLSVLIASSEWDIADPDAELAMVRHAGRGGARCVIHGTRHQVFSDFPLFAAPRLLQKLGVTGSTIPLRGLRAAARVIDRFLHVSDHAGAVDTRAFVRSVSLLDHVTAQEG
jgi:predicted dienelactone hydrolase